MKKVIPKVDSKVQSSKTKRKREVVIVPPVASTTFAISVEGNGGPEDDDNASTPRDETESRLSIEVRKQYPWCKQREVLAAIRRIRRRKSNNLTDPNQPDPVGTTPPQFVIEEISQYRQWIEEARQMDQARLLSEREHEQEDPKRRKNLESTISRANFDEWKSLYFPNSWILQSCLCLESFCQKDPKFRTHLLRLLSLEKKAFQWYSTLCRTYFVRSVCPSIESFYKKNYDSTQAIKCIEQNVQLLEQAMFRLSEQVGGVPRLFREASDDAQECHGENEETVLFLCTKNSNRNDNKIEDSERPVLEIL